MVHQGYSGALSEVRVDVATPDEQHAASAWCLPCILVARRQSSGPARSVNTAAVCHKGTDPVMFTTSHNSLRQPTALSHTIAQNHLQPVSTLQATRVSLTCLPRHLTRIKLTARALSIHLICSSAGALLSKGTLAGAMPQNTQQAKKPSAGPLVVRCLQQAGQLSGKAPLFSTKNTTKTGCEGAPIPVQTAGW